MLRRFIQVCRQTGQLQLGCERLILGRRLCVINRLTFTSCVAKISSISKNYTATLDSVYDERQRDLILKVTNEGNVEDLRFYRLAKSRTESLIKYRDRYGPFANLNDLLEVDGFGLKFLYKFCDNIVYDVAAAATSNGDPVLLRAPSGQTRGRRWKLCDVSVPTEMKENLNSVIAVKFHPDVIVWSHINRQTNEVADWNYVSPERRARVYDHAHNVMWARELFDKLPKADAYIVERRLFDRKSMAVTSYMASLRIVLQIEAVLLTMLPEDRLFAIETGELTKFYAQNYGIKLSDVVQQMVDDEQTMSIASSLRQRFMDWDETVRTLAAECVLRTVAFYDTEIGSKSAP